MHVQPKYLPYEPTTFFDDGRSRTPARPRNCRARPVAPRRTALHRQGEWRVSESFPFPITREDLERGRQRYNIYCTPCHDYTGSGHGMIVQRGFPPPPSYHIDRLRAGAGRAFLRRDDQWLRFDVQLRFARRAGRPLAHRRLHSRAAVEPARHRAGCAGSRSARNDQQQTQIRGNRNERANSHAYLLAYVYWLMIPLGCMAILMMHHLTGGWWGYPDPPPARSRHAHVWRDGAALHPDLAGNEAHLYPWVNPPERWPTIRITISSWHT